MTELVKDHIGENTISKKIGEINWVEAKIKDSYKEIFEKTEELKTLKAEIANNLSGENLKTLIENELTVDHVKNVLNQAVAKFDAEPGVVGFNKVYLEMGAGLTFNLQLALAKLGGKFTRGIDGMYGSKDTRKRVKEFQKSWNALYTDQIISVDGRAGQETLHKIILALDDPKWDRNAGSSAEKTTPSTETVSHLTREEAEKDPAKHHLTKDADGKLQPADGYTWVDKDDAKNLATKKKEPVTPANAPQDGNPPAVDLPKTPVDSNKDVKVVPPVVSKDTNKTVTPPIAPQDGNPTPVDLPDTKKKDKKEKAPAKKETKEKVADKKTEKKAETKKSEKAAPEKKTEAKNLSALDKKYEAAADFFEATLNAAFDPVKKAILIEERVQKEISTETPKGDLPKPDSRFAVLRDRAEAEAIAHINTLAFVKPDFMKLTAGPVKFKSLQVNREGYKAIEDNYAKLKGYEKDIRSTSFYAAKVWGVAKRIKQLMSDYMKYYIDGAFFGTNINTKSFKIFINRWAEEPGIADFQSYGYKTQLNMDKNTIKGLGIKFSDRGETIRVANLINKIRSNYQPTSSKEGRFKLSPTGEIEQVNASSKRFSDLNVVTDYTNFPSLKGAKNNENKRLLIDYLNKTMADVETKQMTQAEFRKLVRPQVSFRNNVNYEEKYPEYLNKLTADKINRAIVQLVKDGYTIDKSIMLGGGTFLLDPDWLKYSKQGTLVYQLDMGQSRASMLKGLKEAMQKPVAPAKAPAKAPVKTETQKPAPAEKHLGPVPAPQKPRAPWTDFEKKGGK